MEPKKRVRRIVKKNTRRYSPKTHGPTGDYADLVADQLHFDDTNTAKLHWFSSLLKPFKEVQKIKSDGPARLGAAVCIFCIASLWWALYGTPPYAFFGWMKLGVVTSCLFLAYTFWSISPKFVVLCAMLLAAGGVHFFGKMHREQWIPFNWAGVAVFTISLIALFMYLSDGRVVAAWRGSVSWLGENVVNIVGYLMFAGCVGGGIYWFNHLPEPTPLTPQEEFAQFLTHKTWTQTQGKISFYLADDNKVTVYKPPTDEASQNEDLEESAGSWAATDQVVTLNASGKGGEYHLVLTPLKDSTGPFLHPVDSELLKDSYFADMTDDSDSGDSQDYE